MAPFAFNMVDFPKQIVGEFEVIVGNGLTMMFTFAEFEQPLESVPVTLYVCVDVGDKLPPFTIAFDQI